MPFDIGFFELCFIAIIALLVLGPERLPTAARSIGRWVSKARRAFTSVKSEIDRELQLDELKQQIKQQQEKMEELVNNQTMQETLSETQQKINDTRAAFEREMAQQNDKQSYAKSEPDSSHKTDSSKKVESHEQQDDDDDMSGCDNPVEFEPLPNTNATDTNDSRTHTIHPPIPDTREPNNQNRQSQTNDNDQSDKPETDAAKK